MSSLNQFKSGYRHLTKTREKSSRPIQAVKQGSFQVTFLAGNLTTKDNFYGFGNYSSIAQNDTYLKILVDDKEIYRSEVKKDTNNPVWDPIIFENKEFTGATKIEVELWDVDQLSKDDLIGKGQLSYPFKTGKEGSINLYKRRKVQGQLSILRLVAPQTIRKCYFEGFDAYDTQVRYTIHSGEGTTSSLCYTSESYTGQITPIFEESVASVPQSKGVLITFSQKHNNQWIEVSNGKVAFPFETGRYKLSNGVYIVFDGYEREVSLVASADGLKDLDWIGKSDPQYTVEFEGKVVYKSEESDNYAAPVWEKAFFKGLGFVAFQYYMRR